MVRRQYGFVADPTKTRNHNAAIMMATTPFWYYCSKPTNSSCHNLCTTIPPPANYRALLGLSLKFIPKPRYTNAKSIISWSDRFRQDIFTKIFMAHCNNEVPRLYSRTPDWTPPIRMINYNLQLRVNNFLKRIYALFKKKRTRSNMLPHQRRLLATLRTSTTHVVINADKNLGPCIIERSKYIQRALDEHLLDELTYKRLTKAQANVHMEHTKTQLQQFIDYNKKRLDPNDIKFLQKSIDVKDPFPKFYLTAKVHKIPWKSRPIVSVSGSQLDGLGRWVDKVLQPYFKSIPSYIASSASLKDKLMSLESLHPTARFFTADAVSMYTNIDTDHALTKISNLLRRLPPMATQHEITAVNEALALIMKKNVFQFGNTYWLQLNGTAMGVSPSCAYATLYFAAHEETFRTKYPELKFYQRYIDDVIGIWEPQTNIDDIRWKEFQKDLNTYGSLRWETSARATLVNFLDLSIRIDQKGKIVTKIYEKADNLYLYLPAQSCHPFSCLKGLIHGMVYRTIRLTSEKHEQAIELQNLVRRLVARGYQQSFLVTIINETYQRINNTSPPTHVNEQPAKKHVDNVVFFHTYYHPDDPKPFELQKAFQEEMLAPKNMYKKLPDLLNHRKAKLKVDKMLIAYHRTPNLGNLLSNRVIKSGKGPPVSSFIG
jgi:hypothetical protein